MIKGKFEKFIYHWRLNKKKAVKKAILYFPLKFLNYDSLKCLAIKRRLGLIDNINELEVENLVISPGGVGTTFLMLHLEKFIKLNSPHDVDGIKHLPVLPKSWIDTKRILFLTGDYKDISFSLRRRGWIGIQSAKLGCILCQFTSGGLREFLFHKRVMHQLGFFYKIRNKQNVLIIDYDDIWRKKLEIKEFFEIGNNEFLTMFPQKKTRLFNRDLGHHEY